MNEKRNAAYETYIQSGAGGMNSIARRMFWLHFNAFYKYTQLKIDTNLPFSFNSHVCVCCLLCDNTLN